MARETEEISCVNYIPISDRALRMQGSRPITLFETINVQDETGDQEAVIGDYVNIYDQKRFAGVYVRRIEMVNQKHLRRQPVFPAGGGVLDTWHSMSDESGNESRPKHFHASLDPYSYFSNGTAELVDKLSLKDKSVLRVGLQALPTRYTMSSGGAVYLQLPSYDEVTSQVRLALSHTEENDDTDQIWLFDEEGEFDPMDFFELPPSHLDEEGELRKDIPWLGLSPYRFRMVENEKGSFFEMHLGASPTVTVDGNLYTFSYVTGVCFTQPDREMRVKALQEIVEKFGANELYLRNIFNPYLRISANQVA